MINTGDSRNVTGHVVSGAIASSVVAGSINYNKYKKNEITKDEAIKNSIKLTAQGGIATGSAVAAANYLGRGSYLGMVAAISLGFAGVYAVEKVTEKLNETRMIEESIEENIEEEEK